MLGGSFLQSSASKVEDDVAAFGEAIRKSFFLLKLYAGDAGAWSEFDLADLTRQIVLDQQEATHSKNIEVVISEISAKPVWGYVDAVRESIQCLIENGISHSKAGLRVEVTVGPSASVIVEDDGLGISDDVSAAHFQAFTVPAPDGIGAGIGLPIAAATARLHNGSLEISRSVMGGARVALNLEV